MSNTSKIVLAAFILVVLIVGGRAIFHKRSGGVVTSVNPPTSTYQNQQNQPVVTPLPAPIVSNVVPAMQSTGALFSQYKNRSKAYEIFPTLGTGTKKALGAFNYKKTDLGNNMYQFTLVNSAEGYKGQTVVVSGDQFVYFIEPSTGDDSVSEDSITTDDTLMAVNAQGYILK